MEDFDLRKSPDEPPPLPLPAAPRPVGLWVATAVLVVVAVFAAYFLINRQRPTPAEQVSDATEQPPPVQALGAEPEAIAVPPLDESDALVRELIKKLSTHPHIAAWLATDGLIRNFTVAVSNIADGPTPARQLRVLRPTSAFRVVEHGEDLEIDPRSFERYDALAAAAASIDADGAARLYATLKPRLEEAFAELGRPDTTFDRTLEQAIVQLLSTPILNGSTAVEPHGGTGYRFADPALESLTPAQKQLLRTGPRNVRTIQASLRGIALALKIPASRLPPPQL